MDRTRPSLFDFTGRTIWVMGGAGYLGQEVVLLLNKLGAIVVCIDLDQKAEDFVQRRELNERVIPVTFDAGSTDVVDDFVEGLINRVGVPHGLVNLTFGSTSKMLEELTDRDFDSANHIGITSVFILAREVGKYMIKEKRGSIVLFSSMYGIVSPDPEVYEQPMNTNPIEYGVAKAGLIQMAKYMAVHWGKSNVRCNCISPGPFPSPAVQGEHPEFIERLATKSPMGRIGQSPEIAGAVAFLLSDAASYVTGHNLVVDGGWTIL